MIGGSLSTAAGLLASIPSPSKGMVHLGPVPLRGYALCILLGVFAAIVVARRRWVARGGERRLIGDLAVWVVPGGLIGARLYHVATDYQLYTHDPAGALRIWDGGLGIWGGVAGGALTGLWVARRWHVDFLALADTVAPALPLAQAIGRWGNWFNQELFGRPTSLPWGLRIDAAHRPAGYTGHTTFHPTFLYESLWSLAVVAIVLAVERRVRLRPGRLFAVYVAAYTFGRFWVELLRIDPAHRVGGLRINDWTSVAVFVVAMAFVLTGRRRVPAPEEVPASEAVLAPAAPGAVPAPEVPAEREPAPVPVVVALPQGGSDGGQGGDGQDGHQVEEGVGEHRGAQPAQADGDAEDHPGGGDAHDDRDVGQPVDRVDVGQPEEHRLEPDRPHRPEAVEERALDHAPEEQLLDDRRPDHGEQGHHDKAGGFWAEDPKDLVVGPSEPSRPEHEGGDGDGDRHPGGERHEQAPADVAPPHPEPEVASHPAAAEAPADDPARPQEPRPQPGLAGEEPPDPGHAERLPGQAQPDGGGDAPHEPHQGDDRRPGG
jgi:prolipoprotein diacylglyceryl transferase